MRRKEAARASACRPFDYTGYGSSMTEKRSLKSSVHAGTRLCESGEAAPLNISALNVAGDGERRTQCDAEDGNCW